MSNKPITMLKEALQESVFILIEMTEEGTEAWEKLNGILLCLIGAVDSAGKLTPEYSTNGLWELTDDNVLVPSVAARAAAIVLGNDLSTKHVTEVLGTLANVEGDQAEAFHEWLVRLGNGGEGELAVDDTSKLD